MALNADNQTATLTASTADTVNVASYYDEVVITNGSTAALLVQTNGTTASPTNFQAAIAPGQTGVVGNAQPRQPVVSPTAPGSTVQGSGWQNATPQGSLNQTAGGANHTVVSLYSTAAGTVELVFQ